MLAYLSGTVIIRAETSLIINVHDLGYRVFVVTSCLHKTAVGMAMTLYLHQHARDDAQELYGFETLEELHLFEKLVSVSGVGPKTAMGCMGSATVEGIIGAISRGDASLLRAVSGIGGKVAERIVVELKKSFPENVSSGAFANTAGDAEIIDALVNLGYSARDAHEAVRSFSGSAASSVEERLKTALKSLSLRKR